jgi:hypothetical protein
VKGKDMDAVEVRTQLDHPIQVDFDLHAAAKKEEMSQSSPDRSPGLGPVYVNAQDAAEARTHSNLAIELGKAKRFPEMEAETLEAAQLDPSKAGQYYYQLGAMLVTAGQFEQAEAAFRKAIEADPKHAESYFQLGVCLSAKASTADGKVTPVPGTLEAFQKYLDLAPTGPNAVAARYLLTTMGAMGTHASAPRRESQQPPAASLPPVQLKLPATYVNAHAPADQLQLNADNSFSLQEAGQPYRGTFAVNGNEVELNIADGPKTTVTIEGNSLKDSSGQTWVLRGQSAGTAPAGPMLKNEDIVKMAKAGLDDALIIAKIGTSKCQFDTSTDALIQLKGSGVSATLLKAMVGAGK